MELDSLTTLIALAVLAWVIRSFENNTIRRRIHTNSGPPINVKVPKGLDPAVYLDTWLELEALKGKEWDRSRFCYDAERYGYMIRPVRPPAPPPQVPNLKTNPPATDRLRKGGPEPTIIPTNPSWPERIK